MCNTIIFGCGHGVTTECNLPKAAAHPLTTNDHARQDELRKLQNVQNQAQVHSSKIMFCPGPRPATTSHTTDPCYICIMNITGEEFRARRAEAGSSSSSRGMGNFAQDEGNGRPPVRFGNNGFQAPMLQDDRVASWSGFGTGLRLEYSGFGGSASVNGNVNGYGNGNGYVNSHVNGNGYGTGYGDGNGHGNEGQGAGEAAGGDMRRGGRATHHYGQHSYGEQYGRMGGAGGPSDLFGRRSGSI